MSTDVHRPLMTVREAAEWLRVSQITVRRMIASGELVGYQLGGPGTSIRIDQQLAEQWLTRDGLEELRRQILECAERADRGEPGAEDELWRLRDQYRQHAVLERPMPAPELRPPDAA